MIKIKYSKTELLIALFGIREKQSSDSQKLKQIEKEMRVLLPHKEAELNEKICGYHGIGLETLVNSPKYKTFCDEYCEYAVREMVKKFMRKLRFTEKQVWALIAAATGLLDYD